MYWFSQLIQSLRLLILYQLKSLREPRKTHMWTFLTTVLFLFVSISAFPSLSSLISFRLNKTFPCHGILKVVNMCMSNAMNMDVTSFFGAWPSACPNAGNHPPKAQDSTSQWAQRAEETQLRPHWKHTHTRTDRHKSSDDTHRRTCKCTCMHTYTETHMLRLPLFCLSSLTFHNVFYIKIKEGSSKSLKKEVREESDL